MKGLYIVFEKEKYRDSYERHDYDTAAQAAEAIVSGEFKEDFVVVQRMGITIAEVTGADAFETKEEREEREAKEAEVRAFDEAIMGTAPAAPVNMAIASTGMELGPVNFPAEATAAPAETKAATDEEIF